ncbi:hypothetical protein QE152_g25729 [Popillia japonica]|uniref:Uncharacterized protein n=1 Tax=Popillia japonica TaxID=7064 RepID=A0AAW1JZ38_POPJA
MTPEEALSFIISSGFTKQQYMLIRATALKRRTCACYCNESRDKSTADLIIESASTTPTRGKRILEKWRSPEEEEKAMTPEEALSFIISSGFTKQQYMLIRATDT